MANVIKPKRTTTASSVPTTGQLADGEMAVNIPDGKIFVRNGLGVFTVAEKNPTPASTIVDGDTANSPSNNAVFDALALKADDTEFASGTYTPTLTDIVNIASSSSYLWTYQRVGKTVTMSGSLTVTPIASGTQTTVRISLPIASVFGSNMDVGGAGTAMRADYSSSVPARVQANAANNLIAISFNPGTITGYVVAVAVSYPIP